MLAKIKLSHCIAIALEALALVSGYAIGRQNTIQQAELIEITETEYLIGFGDEIHIYDK
jgi:hypothetical protein